MTETYLAIVTTTLAILGIGFTFLQYQLAKKKRKDDLFSLRFEYYEAISHIWTSTNNKSYPPLTLESVLIASEKARFLFGDDIAKHVLSLEGKRASHGLFADDDFSKPFRKYLKLN